MIEEYLALVSGYAVHERGKCDGTSVEGEFTPCLSQVDKGCLF